jgi:hypothetical protein
MGEASRKRKSMASAPCRCGSGKRAGTCCLGKTGWYKTPALVNLPNTGHNGSHPRCYLQGLHTCSDKISGEHIISETVLRAVAPDRLIASGFHWLRGDERPVAYSSLTTNNLCIVHNSRLSDLDAAAGRFFDAVKQCDLNRSETGCDFLFSGHDLERWVLKTTANIVASKNVARGGGPLLATLHPKIAIADMLQDPKAWPAGTGSITCSGSGMTFSEMITSGLSRSRSASLPRLSL